MKIVHVTSALCRAGAGVKGAVESLSAAQMRLGADVQVFGLSSPHWKGGDRDAWQGAPARVFQTSGPAAYGYASGLLPALTETAPCVVHLHGLWMYPSKAVADWSIKTGAPFLFSVHGMLSPVALAFSGFKKQLARRLFADRIFARAAAFQATSDAEFDDIRRFGIKAPVSIVPHGVDLAEVPAKATRSGSKKSVLSLGRLHPIKGLDLLVEAWARLEPDFPDWELNIVGPAHDGYDVTLRDKAARLDLKSVRVLGSIYGEEKLSLMAEASIFALPSRNENFALTVCESLMMQTPVVASRGTPWRGLEEHGCGRWVSPDPAPLANALHDLMSLPDLDRAAMGQRGRAWIEEEFTWPTLAQQTLETYGWLTEQNPKPLHVYTADRASP